MSASPFQLIRATESDIDTIHRLAVRIWWEHYPPIIGEHQVTYMLNRMYAHDVLLKQILEGPQQFFLIQENQHPIGFISVEANANNEAFIHKFYIVSDIRRTGLGKKAFDAMLELFPETSILKLQVNRQNFKAINFYFKIGFTIEKSADFDIGDGYFMNDFVMVWKKEKNEPLPTTEKAIQH